MIADIPTKKPSFWLLHLVGWSGYIVLMLIEDFLIAGWQYIYDWAFALFIIACIGALFTALMRLVYQKLWNFSAITIFISILLCCLFFALPWAYFKNQLIYFVYADVVQAPTEMKSWFTGFAMSWFMLMTWSGLYFAINLFYRLNDALKKSLIGTNTVTPFSD